MAPEIEPAVARGSRRCHARRLFSFAQAQRPLRSQVLSHGRQIFLAGMLVNQPESERQHDRDSLKSRRWISFREYFVRVLELVTFWHSGAAADRAAHDSPKNPDSPAAFLDSPAATRNRRLIVRGGSFGVIFSCHVCCVGAVADPNKPAAAFS